MKKIIIGQQVVQWVQDKTDADFGVAVGFGVEQDGEIIAGVVFCGYNESSMFIHVASNGTATWMTKELLLMVFDYAFNQAKVNVLLGPVGCKNLAARRFDEHIGFKLAVEIPDAHPDGSLLIYKMHRDECRWLRKKHGKTESTAAA